MTRRTALWLHYPRPEDYFADPAAHAWLGRATLADTQTRYPRADLTPYQ